MSEGETALDGYDAKAKAEVQALLEDVGRILS
jgi:hypothetical protein